jgi:hypothetical protein
MISITKFKLGQWQKLFKIFKSSLMQSLNIFGTWEGIYFAFQCFEEFKIYLGKDLNHAGPTRQSLSDRVLGAIPTVAAAICRHPSFPHRPYPCACAPRWRCPPLLFCLRLMLTVHLCSHSCCRHACHGRPPPLSLIVVQAGVKGSPSSPHHAVPGGSSN